MKKTNFLSGLAAVVLAGCMFTSCEKEDLKATFQAGPAEVTINTNVVYALTGKTVTPDALTANPATFNPQGTAEFATGVTETNVTITATYGNASNDASIKVNALKVGGKANYSATVVITDELDLDVKTTELTATEVVKYATFNHMNHAHDGATTWAINATDYYQPFTVTYTNVEAQATEALTTTTLFSELDAANQDAVKNIYAGIKSLDNETETEDTIEGGAGAWSYFCAYATYTTTPVKYTIVTKEAGLEVANFIVNVTSTAAEFTEKAHPDHAGHWTEGHGHAGASNAGGGISMAE